MAPLNTLLADGKPVIMAFWHGRLLMMSAFWPKDKPFNMLISHHRDGELISRTTAHFGINSVRGSTKKGGAQAIRTLVRDLSNGISAGVTPDGPHGPRMRVSDGIISLACLSGAPIIPLTAAARSRRLLGSWDRFMVPLPFTKGIYLISDPIYVARDADPESCEALRLSLEDCLTELTIKADTLCGQDTPIPDPAPGTPSTTGDKSDAVAQS